MQWVRLKHYNVGHVHHGETARSEIHSAEWRAHRILGLHRKPPKASHLPHNVPIAQVSYEEPLPSTTCMRISPTRKLHLSLESTGLFNGYDDDRQIIRCTSYVRCTVYVVPPTLCIVRRKYNNPLEAWEALRRQARIPSKLRRKRNTVVKRIKNTMIKRIEKRKVPNYIHSKTETKAPS